MKKNVSFIFAVIFTLAVFFKVNAQSAETIWLSTNITDYKTGETVVVAVNAVSGAPIQGFRYQIRYDSKCLQLIGADSPILGMTPSPIPQTPGLAKATFASAAPQTANGILAEAKFLALGECRTNLTLESAALTIRKETGMSEPLMGVMLGKKNIALNIDKGLGSVNPIGGKTPLPFASATPPTGNQGLPAWLLILFSLLTGATGVLVSINLIRKP